MNTLFALVFIVFAPSDHGAHADLTVIDHLNAEDCMAELASRDVEEDLGVWACTPDYDY